MKATNRIKERIAEEAKKRRRMRSLTCAIRDNSLSIVLFALFVICIFAQSFAGWWLQNEILAAHGQASVGYWHNLFTGTFLEGLATNWQAAFLQLASLIVFSGFLYQRGAPHSRDPLKAKQQAEPAQSWPLLLALPPFAVLAFLLLFVLSLAHACRLRRRGL